MFWVYVLRSRTSGDFYTGSTSDLTRRLSEHKEGISFYTGSGGPWEPVHDEEFATRADAMRREKYLKTGKGREELQRLLAGAGQKTQPARVDHEPAAGRKPVVR